MLLLRTSMPSTAAARIVGRCVLRNATLGLNAQTMRHISMADIYRKSPNETASSIPDIPATVPASEALRLDTPASPLMSDQLDVPLAKDLTGVPSELSSDYVQQVLSSGKSLVVEMDLFSWWTPPSYFRYALECLHFDVGLPWWTTIMAATCALRLLLIWVPIRAQKYAGKVAPHQEKFKEFDERLQIARIDKNMALCQQIILERRDYCKKHDVSPISQLATLFANGFVFTTQFFAIEKMAKASFPGLSSGGALWFENLVAADPYYILPAVSAVTVWATVKYGMEFGSQQTMPPVMKTFLHYGLPPVIFICSTQFPAAVCLYWCTSNFISLLYTALFSFTAVRNVLGLPPPMAAPTDSEARGNAWTQTWGQIQERTKELQRDARYQAQQMKEEDARRFKEAGQAGKKPTSKQSDQQQDSS